MNTYYLEVSQLREYCNKFNCGDKIYLTGTVYTARDAAHKRIKQLLDNDEKLPFELKDCAIYYAGPTPTPEKLSIGSCGPTTSSRMDNFAPMLYDLGMVASIGKGQRNGQVINAIIRNDAVYLCAIGGAGALASKCIDSCEVIAFDDLGCESVKQLHFNDFPLFVAIDSKGNTLFK